jgi:dihydropteroate synthase
MPSAASALHPPLGSRALIMGILNVTPDSFSDGGRFPDAKAACARAHEMIAEGADIIDIGGESTRPDATPVDAETEVARVLPAIRAIVAESAAPLSIDTYKARTAEAALSAGARIVNDVSGFQRDPDMARVAAAHGATSVLMHNPGHTADPAGDIAQAVRDGLARSVDIALAAGLPESRIVLDPGIGFGKTVAQNLWLVRSAGWLKAQFGLPVLIGASRKRMIAHILGGAETHERLYGTLALHVAAALGGADIIRAHDIGPHRDALRIADALGAARR